MPELKCPTGDELSFYLLGRLPESASERLGAHCEDCPTCQAALETLDGTFDPFLAELRAPGRKLAVASVLPLALEKILDQASSLLDESGPAIQPVLAAGHSIPKKIRDYRLLAKIGEGGMGTVYKALHVNLKRIVALKVLATRRALDPQAVQRFRREMAAVGKLVHPNIVLAYDAGEHNGTQYLVTEFIDGTDLSQLVRILGPLPIADACEIARQAALALAHAHSHTLVHRDIKPSNIMLTERGDVKLLDLGLSRFYADLAHDEQTHELTSEGQIMGTLDYIAPEQACNAQQVDARADLYSLGATLYRLLTGKTPLELSRWSSPIAKLHAILEQVPAATSCQRNEVPPELASLVDELLTKDRERRPASARRLVEMLTPFASGSDLAGLMTRYSATLIAGPALAEPTQSNLSTATSPAVEHSPKAPGSDMAEKPSFDPYHRWLGIPGEEQPPHHYRLLGTQVFESSPEVIEAAADRQMTYLRTLQTGQHSALSQKLLNEIAAAKVTLLHPAKRAAYDATLKKQLAQQQAAQQPAVEKLPKAIPLERAAKAAISTPTAEPQLVTRSASPPSRNLAGDSPVIVGETATMAQRGKRKGNRNTWLMASAGGLLAFVAAVFVVRLANGTGELVIESNVPGVEVEVRRDGVTIETVKVDDNEHRITIRTGDYEVVLKGKNADELVVENETFTLQRDGQAIVKITRRERAADAKVAKVDPKIEPGAEKKTDSITVALGEQKEPPAVPDEPQAKTDPTNSQPTPSGPPIAGIKIAEANPPQPLREGEVWGEKEAWKAIPNQLEGMKFQTSKLPARLNFEVTSPGLVYVAFTSRWGGGGSINAEIAKELTSQDDLLKADWKHVVSLQDTSRHNYQFQVYAKFCRGGETFKLRTEKYVAPILLIPTGIKKTEAPPIAISKSPVVRQVQVPAAVARVGVTNDGQAVLLTLADKMTRLYNIRGGHDIGVPVTAGSVDGILPDGKTMFSAPWEGNFGLRDAVTGAAKEGGFRGWQVKSVTFSRDGRLAAVGQYRGVVTITDLTSGQQREITVGDRGHSIEGLAFSADAQRLLAISGKGTGKIIDVARGVVTSEIEGNLSTLVASLHDERFVTRSADGKVLEVRSFKSGQIVPQAGNWSGHEGLISGIAISNGDGAVVTTSHDKTARLWNTRDGSSQPIWKHTAELEAVAFSPNGAHLVLAGRDGLVRAILDRTTTSPAEQIAAGSPQVASTPGNTPAEQPAPGAEINNTSAEQVKLESAEGMKHAEVINSEVVCKVLAGKREPGGLVEHAKAFQAPDGDGRRGANGFLMQAPQGWRQRGTVWSGTYSRSGSAYGMYLIHPLGDGHIVVSLWNGGLAAGTMKYWANRALAQSEDLMPLVTKVPASAFEIDRDEPHTFRSELTATGSFSFYLDGKLAATGKANHVHALTLSNEGFRGAGLERKLAPGKAGAIIDSLDNGSNTIVDLILALPNSEVGLVAVPNAEAQETARKSLVEIFKSDMDAAKTQPQQSEFAKRLLHEASQNEGNPADHFVVLDEARKYGVEAGDVETAVEAAKATASTYQVERWPLLAETAAAAAKNSRTTAMKVAAMKSFELGQEALAVQQYQAAKLLLETAAATAGRAREFPIAKAARDALKSAESKLDFAQEFEAARLQLEKDATDKPANQLVGEYLCFEMDDWDKGLPHLVAAGDADLQQPLDLERAKPKTTQEQIALGDAWWTAATSKTGATKVHYFSRAGHWYEAALPEATGLEKVKIEKRLKQIGPSS